VFLNIFERFLRLLAYVGGLILLILMGFTVADVLLRYFFNAPLKSVYEFTEFVMAAVVFLGIAYTGWVGGHIAVDMFSKWLDQPRWRWITAALTFVSAALFALIAYRATLETLATINQVSNRLAWPHYPFRFTVAIGCGLFALVLVIQGVQVLRGRRAAGDR
jgi:TRAP-type C4-dicarboxylate transport system permease small subunit